jgi:polyhydroxyalkanoate synthesis repressor PhaR
MSDKTKQIVEIRKYSNRRLYNTEASRYVTLADVAEIIRSGQEIRVIDAQTGEDLTRSVMLQIICESKPEQEALPIGFLREIIQASSQTVRHSIKDFLSLGLQAQKDLQHQVSSWLNTGIHSNPLMNAFISMFSSNANGKSTNTSGADLSATQPPTAVPAHQSNPADNQNARQSEIDTKAELEQLRLHLNMLQQQIEKIEHKQSNSQ